MLHLISILNHSIQSLFIIPNQETMKILFLAFAAFSFISPEPINLSFQFGTLSEKCQDWVLLSDNIMGGVTKSKLEYTENSLVLSGTISLDNYGGFSSVKTRFKNYDLSEYKGLKIRCKSSGQSFAFTLEDSQNWTLPNYKGNFSNTKENEWEWITLFFKDFKEYQIGEPTGNEWPTSNLKNIVRLGIITTEKKEGPFVIEIDRIEFIR